MIGQTFMDDKCPLSLACHCQCTVHDSSVSLLLVRHNSILLFGFLVEETAHQASLDQLKWTFCLCVLDVSSKTTDLRQGTLSPRTAATIVCESEMHVYAQQPTYTCLQMRDVLLILGRIRI